MPAATNEFDQTVYPVASFPQRTLAATRNGMLKKGWPRNRVIVPKHGSFHAALDSVMTAHGDDAKSLLKALPKSKFRVGARAIRDWRQGKRLPSCRASMMVLKSIERHYEVDDGYFAKLLSMFRPTFKRNTECNLNTFHAALNYLMRLHQDSSLSLAKALRRPGDPDYYRMLTSWKTGRSTPRFQRSYKLLARLERRYNLPAGYFMKLVEQPELATKHALKTVRPSSRWMFCWHLPDDFERRSVSSQREIVTWVCNNVLSTSTEFGKYQKWATRQGFSIVFPKDLDPRSFLRPVSPAEKPSVRVIRPGRDDTICAPQALVNEMQSLVSFKMLPLPPAGFSRSSRWGSYTAEKAVRDFGLLFGALVAAPSSPVAGLGMPLQDTTLGLLAFPATWDWYLRWKERRRGFFAFTEKAVLYEAKCLLRKRTGWVRQHPELARRVRPVEGLISRSDINAARLDWDTACDKALEYVMDRIPEMQRTFRIHRDASETIMPVLESRSPMGEYKKITDEILKQMPDEKLHPWGAALAVRSYLIIRFAMHLGVRQRNLRELLLCPKGKAPRSIARLSELRKGEMRWDEAAKRWEVFIPAIAFKNGNSTFFRGKPYRLHLPDIGDLYKYIDAYIERHRPYLLGGAKNPNDFFVSGSKTSTRANGYNSGCFYNAWRAIIQRYGIYNPYTGRGAISGLKPHGPHVIRDIIATHILRQTGSYELAGFAIQDTPQAVSRHYARYFPHEKTARAAEILNQVWLPSK